MPSYPSTPLNADATATVLPMPAACAVTAGDRSPARRTADVDARPTSGASDTHLRSLVKAVSWRCVGTVDTFVVSFAVLMLTGAAGAGIGHAARVSGGIAAVEVVTKILLYYLHERAWAKVKLGRGAAA